jgi:hypothetical protein
MQLVATATEDDGYVLEVADSWQGSGSGMTWACPEALRTPA